MSENNDFDYLQLAADYMQQYLQELPQRRVFPAAQQIKALDDFEVPLPQSGCAPQDVLKWLHQTGSPATVATAGGRYYGFVIGGSLPSALGAYCLAGAWDQCAGLHVLSPTAEKLEQVAGSWLKELLGIPAQAATGFVTGATMANFTGLAAARHALLKNLGWNIEASGLYGAPEIRVIVGEEVHVSVLKALSLLGFGSERVERVPVDHQGRMRAEDLRLQDGPTILCLQAGNVDSGAVDPLRDIMSDTQRDDIWVHIDGAFGLWAAASSSLSHLVEGAEMADSWAVDLHKWLNVPYDSGVVFCKDPEYLRASMSVNAAYLPPPGAQGPYQFTPGMSRRGRGIEAYAALYSLGREGVEMLIDNCCIHARRFAEALSQAGFEVLNEVVLNQVLVDLGPRTELIMETLQQQGTCWVAGTTWQGRKAMRISVSSWATTSEDVERSIAAMIKAAETTT